MGISDEVFQAAFRQLSAIPSVEFDPESLAEDVFLLGKAYPDEASFALAAASANRALRQLAEGRVTTSKLKYEFEGLSSFHFQAHRQQGAPADMRIVFRREDGRVRVVGFGNRRIPSDIYERLSASQRSM